MSIWGKSAAQHEIDRLTRERDGLARERNKLAEGICNYLDGNYDRPGIKRKVDQCPHGMFSWDTCENCIDEHFQQVLKEARA